MGDVSKRVWLIFIDEFLESLKTRKALVIIVSYLFLMFIGIKIGSMFEVFAWAIAGSRQSFSILLPYYISVGLLPLFSIIISYNVLSEEMSEGSIKFMAYRVDRFSILLGKVLSSFALSCLMILVAYITSLIYIYLKIGLWFYLPYSISWIYLTAYSFCFICLTTLLSMVTKTPSSSITSSIFVSIVFIVMLNFSYLKYASPFYFSGGALEYINKGILINGLLGLLILMLHTWLYFLASYALIKRTDLD